MRMASLSENHLPPGGTAGKESVPLLKVLDTQAPGKRPKKDYLRPLTSDSAVYETTLRARAYIDIFYPIDDVSSHPRNISRRKCDGKTDRSCFTRDMFIGNSLSLNVN